MQERDRDMFLLEGTADLLCPSKRVDRRRAIRNWHQNSLERDRAVHERDDAPPTLRHEERGGSRPVRHGLCNRRPQPAGHAASTFRSEHDQIGINVADCVQTSTRRAPCHFPRA